jgi:hypothetical protein|nr:MAG TPA: hypothetical protein [Caudoviricetes sp.]
MGKNHAKLDSIVPFMDDERWYLKLIYKYEDGKGNKHTVVYPKVTIPFSQGVIPYINTPASYDLNGQFAFDRPYIDCCDSMVLHKSVCDLASVRGVTTPAYYFDIITEYASREMTLDEIEKELGYKVKIINKEKNDGNSKKM